MNGMTFEQLKIFLEVAQHLHFTKAAEILFLTQPAVSAAIQRLEEQYEVKLFERTGRRVELTEAGKFLQQEAQTILDQVSLTERGLREFTNLKRGNLKLGASLTTGNYWLPSLISRFKRQHSGIQISCHLNNTEAIISGTVSGQFDLGLVAGIVQPDNIDSLTQQVVGYDRLQVIVGCTHPWFERTTVSLTDLLTASWVMREAGSGTRQQFEQKLRTFGIDPSKLIIQIEMSSGEMVKAAVEEGAGITAISELLIKKELQLETLKILQVTDSANNTVALSEMNRPFILLKHQKRFQTRAAASFEQFLISYNNLSDGPIQG
jgi:DNA-binding transcriptional LysR family regulator